MLPCGLELKAGILSRGLRGMRGAIDAPGIFVSENSTYL